MKLRYMVDCVLRHDEHGRPWYEPVGVWVQGPGPGLDIEMFYIDSQDSAILARRDEANWVLNRLVEGDVTGLPEDFLEYHRRTRPPYDGLFSQITETDKYSSAETLEGQVLDKLVEQPTMQLHERAAGNLPATGTTNSEETHGELGIQPS